MSLVIFAHVFGIAMWIGGAIAGMVIASAAAGESPEARAAAFRILTRVHTTVIGVGALIVVGSGVLLVMVRNNDLAEMMRDPSLWVMICAGLVAGLIVMFVGLPTAARMGALAVTSSKGELPPAFESYRRRLGTVSAISGSLAVLALLAWYVL
jgi:uncharacterized membrane protein